MKKVLHVIDSFGVGGAQQFLANVLKHFNPTLFEHHIAGLNRTDHKYLHIYKDICPNIHILNSRNSDPLSLYRLLSLIDNIKPDIIHAHLITACFYIQICKLLKKTNAKVVLHIQAPYLSQKESTLQYFLEPYSYLKNDKVIACSQIVADSLPESIHRDKIEVVHNCIDDTEISLSISEQESAKDTRCIPTIVSIGRISEQKNYNYALEVIAELVKLTPLRYLILGEGKQKKKLLKYVDKLGIKDVVDFLDQSHAPETILNRADFLLLTSIYEGLPLIILEAFAKGVPVISTPYLGSDEVITQNPINGIIIPWDEAEKSANLIYSTHKNSMIRSSIIKNANETLLKLFTASKAARRLEILYDKSLREYEKSTNSIRTSL